VASDREIVAEPAEFPTAPLTLAASRDGRLHVFYSGGDAPPTAPYWGPLRYRSRSPEGIWEPEVMLGASNKLAAGSATLVLDADDQPLFLSNDVSAPARLSVAECGADACPGEWQQLFDGLDFESVQGVAAVRTSDGEVHVALLMNRGAGPEELAEQRLFYLSRSPAGSWNTAREIGGGALWGGGTGLSSVPDGFGGRPQLLADADDNLWLLWPSWGSAAGERYRVMHWSRPRAGDWSSRKHLPDGVQGRAWIDPRGDRHLFWTEVPYPQQSSCILWHYWLPAGSSSGGYEGLTSPYLLFGPTPAAENDRGLVLVAEAYPIGAQGRQTRFVELSYEPGAGCTFGDTLVPPEEFEAVLGQDFGVIVVGGRLHLFWQPQHPVAPDQYTYPVYHREVPFGVVVVPASATP
jgi:hypothetical protein